MRKIVWAAAGGLAAAAGATAATKMVRAARRRKRIAEVIKGYDWEPTEIADMTVAHARGTALNAVVKLRAPQDRLVHAHVSNDGLTNMGWAPVDDTDGLRVFPEDLAHGSRSEVFHHLAAA